MSPLVKIFLRLHQTQTQTISFGWKHSGFLSGNNPVINDLTPLSLSRGLHSTCTMSCLSVWPTGTWHLVHCTLYSLLASTWYIVHCNGKYLVHCNNILIHRYLVHCTLYWPTGTRYIALAHLYLVHCTLYWRLVTWQIVQGVFFLAPPNLTKSQAHYKFFYLDNFRGGQFKLCRAWDLVKFRGDQKKKPPCLLYWRTGT